MRRRRHSHKAVVHHDYALWLCFFTITALLCIIIYMGKTC